MSNSTDNLTWTRIEVFSRVRFYCSVLPGAVTRVSTKQWQNISSSSFSTATATRKVTPWAFLAPTRNQKKLSLNHGTQNFLVVPKIPHFHTHR